RAVLGAAHARADAPLVRADHARRRRHARPLGREVRRARPQRARRYGARANRDLQRVLAALPDRATAPRRVARVAVTLRLHLHLSVGAGAILRTDAATSPRGPAKGGHRRVAAALLRILRAGTSGPLRAGARATDDLRHRRC